MILLVFLALSIFFHQYMTQVLSFSLLASLFLSASAATNATAPATTAKLPEYSKLSFFTGLIVMLGFVVGPVAFMAYRNRNSILEFIKDR